MKCEECRELIWDALEEELSAEKAAELHTHLEGCESCREEWEETKKIMEALQELPEEELPKGYHEELMQKLQAEKCVIPFPKKKKMTPKWKQLSMIAAAALIVVAAGGVKGIMDMRQAQDEAVRQMENGIAAENIETEEKIREERGVQEETQGQLTETQGSFTPAPLLAEEAPKATPKRTESKVQGSAPKEKEQPKTEVSYRAAQEEQGSTEDQTLAETAEAPPAEPFMDQGGNLLTAQARGPVPEETVVKEDMTEMVLTVMDLQTAKTAVQEAIVANGGREEATDLENTVVALIPKENTEDFYKALEEIGQTRTLQKMEEEAAESRIQITLEIQ